MVLVHEIKLRTQGFLGGPGWTTFYFDGDDTAEYDQHFRSARIVLLDQGQVEPTQWSGVVLEQSKLLNATTGALVDFANIPDDGTGNVVPGVAGTSYGAGVAGMCLSWSTAGVNRGRRVRGRTFIVPLAEGAYDPDGTLTSATMNGFRTDLAGFTDGSLGFGVWSRPRLGTGGAWFPCNGLQITDQSAFLSSRRS